MTEDPGSRLPPASPARPGSGRDRGYWIDPSPAGTPTPSSEAAAPGAPGLGAPVGTRVYQAESAARPQDRAAGRDGAPAENHADWSPVSNRGGRARAKRKRRLMRLVALLVVLGGLVTAVALIVTGRTVVPVVSQSLYPIDYKADIARVAEEYGLDPYLVAAVVKTESGFDSGAVSPVGAVGLMQLMPDTAAWLIGLDIWRGDGEPRLSDPADNLELGACYLAYLTEKFGEDNIVATLAAYNAGPTAVGRWVEAAGGADAFVLDDIEFPETRTFVERVEHYWLLYARIHPGIFAATGGA
jgi:soluble lytic murein transglycosylase